jgi:hypothetical protein
MAMIVLSILRRMHSLTCRDRHLSAHDVIVLSTLALGGAGVLGGAGSTLAWAANMDASSSAGESLTNPELRVFPESLEFAATQIGSQSTRQTDFDNTGDTTLEVSALDTPLAPFEAKGLPPIGTEIRPGGEYVVEIVFKPVAAGQFHDSLSVSTGDEPAKVVTLSASGIAPASNQATAAPELPVAMSTIPASPPDAGNPPTAGAVEPSPALTHLQVRPSTARAAKHRRVLLIAYTLSRGGKVELAVDRRTVSHRCPQRERSCVRWLATKVKLDVTARAGHNSATLSLAALAAGEYRLDATPLARSGALGTTQRVSFTSS